MTQTIRPHRTAAILAIGDELTLGQALDTNSRWLAERLTALGVVPIEHATVDDDLPRLTEALARLSMRADTVVCTGGLGPTADDLTREALAGVMGEALEEDNAALAVIRAWFEGRGRVMPDRNRVQAHRPRSARFLDNPNGTAPGLAARVGDADTGADVFCLPGPPREMKPMFEDHVLPALRPDPQRSVRTRVLKTFGLGESAAAERLRHSDEGDLMRRDRVPLVGLTASLGILSVRLRYEGPGDADEAERLLDETESAVRARLGAYLFASGDTSLAETVLRTLETRQETLAVAESCTGGLVGATLTDIPGSSSAFRGGWITYNDEMKQAHLGVPAVLFKSAGGPDAPGAVSAEVARAMAVGALDRAPADHALALTGIAGPGGATPGKPVGTVYIARASRNGETDVRRFEFLGGRESVRVWSATSALAMLSLALAGGEARALPLLGERTERASGAV